MKKISVETARTINDALHSLIQLHISLDVLNHEELYGNLSATIAAVKECSRIAMRDVDRRPRQPAEPERKKKR